jgi:folylpolyglutamate synthase
MPFVVRFPFLSITLHTQRLNFFPFSGRRMSTTPSRTYKDAIDALNTLQTNAAVLEVVRAAGAKLNPNAIPEMIDYLRRVGLEVLYLSILLSRP